ncbi:hypothetical protein GCM10018966_078090 [Streptomyces yanii]
MHVQQRAADAPGNRASGLAGALDKFPVAAREAVDRGDDGGRALAKTSLIRPSGHAAQGVLRHVPKAGPRSGNGA